VKQALALVEKGAQLLDTRESAEFEGAHMRGAINIGLGGSFATWCGTLLDHDRPVVLVAAPGREVEAATRLGRIGFDSVAGYLDGGMEQLDHAPELVERTPRLTARALAEQLASSEPPVVIDVRTASEWEAGRIDGAVNLPLSRLRDQLDTLPDDRPLIAYCTSGYRSAIATSVLRHARQQEIADLVGGLAAWESARLVTIP
jgi:rhodanese-related sulfurtransferase